MFSLGSWVRLGVWRRRKVVLPYLKKNAGHNRANRQDSCSGTASAGAASPGTGLESNHAGNSTVRTFGYPRRLDGDQSAAWATGQGGKPCARAGPLARSTDPGYAHRRYPARASTEVGAGGGVDTAPACCTPGSVRILHFSQTASQAAARASRWLPRPRHTRGTLPRSRDTEWSPCLYFKVT